MGKFSRLTLEFFLLLMIAGALLLLTLRYRILPEIERYHEQITAAASSAIGQPLTVGKIQADWNGLRPRLILSDVKILDKQGNVALNLPRLENTVAWMSLPAMELRFRSLVIDGPDLAVRRDGEGHWFVAGIPLDTQPSNDKSSTGADWLLHQNTLEIRNGRLSWQDDLRAAPQLKLEKVELAIDNHWDHHRFALRATAPARLASDLDVRGNFYGDSFQAIDGWRGELFTQLEYADVGAWKPWIPLPDLFRRGKGALRTWISFEQGKLHSIDADVVLAGVLARLAEDRPQLDLSELRGRIGWHLLEHGFEVKTAQLAMRMRNGFKLKPTDFYLRLDGSEESQFAAGEVRANHLEFGDLGTVATYLPLGDALQKQIADTAPHGRATELHAQWQAGGKGLRYEVKARFDGLSMHPIGDIPGFSGLSGSIEGNDNGGSLIVDSRKLGLDSAFLFSEPIEFDRFKARLGWQRIARGIEVKLSNVELANADLAGTLFGSYQSEAEGPGYLDASVDMTRVAVSKTGRYTPIPAVGKETHDWLQKALQGGQADKFKLRIRGNLREFPFVGNTNGIFRLEARARGVQMEFLKDWPRIEEAQTQLLIEGNKLDVRALSATSAGVQLQNVSVNIPNLLADHPVLMIKGEAADATQRGLDYIGKSPVYGYLGGFTEGVVAQGNGKLTLQLDVPLSGESQVKLRGNYHFNNNDIDFGPRIPRLRSLTGDLAFTDSSVSASNLAAQILGGPAQLSVSSEGEAISVKGQGKLDLDAFSKLTPHPLFRRVHGTTDWKAAINARNKLVDVQVDSDLQGIDSTLPIPLNKRSSDRLPMHFGVKDINAHQDNVTVMLGTLLDARVQRQQEGDNWPIRNGRIAFGGSTNRVPKEGLYLVGHLPQLSLEGWNGLGMASNGGGVLPNVAGIDVVVDKLTAYGSAANALEVKGSSRNGLVSLRLTSRELNGDIIWQPQGNGKLLGRFKNASLAEWHSEMTAAQPSAQQKPLETDNHDFPDVDVSVEKLSYKGRQLGRLQMEMSQADGIVSLDSWLLTNPDGTVKMDGKWLAKPEQIQLNLRIDITDAGKILSRSGYPDSLKDGNGSLESKLRWAGSLGDFDYSRLNGIVSLRVGKGRFLKVEAGPAKLLGVLSLQSLPKRISLDFTDVFSGGFEFDSITGNAQITNGLLQTDDMMLTGSAARVTLKGQVDLIRETQDLKVRVLPTIGDNVSLLSMAVINPVVGVGVLLANKILRDPLDKLVSFDYNVSGSWTDPKVEKAGASRPIPGNAIPGE